MVSLDDFLKTKDLDDLFKVRRSLGELSADDKARIADILRQWQDGQAISNLLFCPLLIPDDIRHNSIDRALHCTDNPTDNPYFALAAVCGLKAIKPETLDLETGKRWVLRLLLFVRSKAGVLSERASVTIWPWLTSDDEIKDFVCAYPVPEKTASDNIMSFTLSRFGELTSKEFRERLRTFGLGFWRRRPFVRRFTEYCKKKKAGKDVFVGPLLAYIPNYRPISRS